MTPPDFRALRLSLALTQGQAARLCGVDARTWRRWEAGDRKPAEAVLRLLRLMQDMPGVREWLEDRG